jgi:translation initiation factor RLI1
MQPEGGEAPKPGQLDRKPFKLHVEAGAFTDSEIVVMLGEVRCRGSVCVCVCGLWASGDASRLVGLSFQVAESFLFQMHTHQNGTGKTTFVRMLAGVLKSDEEEAAIKAGDEDLAETLG